MPPKSTKSRRPSRGFIPGLMLAFAAVVEMNPALAGEVPDRKDMVRYAAESGERVWRRALDPPEGLTSRELFAYALALCEAGIHTERLGRLFELATEMQDRDPRSRGYGNFRWRRSEGSVQDYNAVEFCMHTGAVIWLRHRDTLGPEVRGRLRELLEYSVQGCLRHRVSESYTNIALMNAQNLILLGEALSRPEVADEGYGRLDRFVMYTWEFGIHEYGSPTYYGVDLDCLGLIEAFCGRESGREQARALLELFWTDIALNWFPAAGKLGGAHSRDYNYLRGLGMLDVQMWAAGWLRGEARGGTGAIQPALARWRPPERLREMSRKRFPRLVRQSWGVAAPESRTHYMLRDVTLGTAGANYGAMDLPLTVDLAGDRESLRCYFIPDARRDPYGRKKIPAGPHRKTLHLRPFWAAAQRAGDALGLVIYRDGDLPETPATLESHFVIPRDVDGLWIGGRRVRIHEDRPAVVPLELDEALVLRKGTAAVGVRVPWARGLDGERAHVALVDDGNRHGAVRLTVAHHGLWGAQAPGADAGAAFWVRIGGGLESEADFHRWRADFERAAAEVEASAERVLVRAEGAEGQVAVGAAAPYTGCFVVNPPPSRGVLELDGEDIGKRILRDLELVKTYETRLARAAANAVIVEGASYWEAESGAVVPPMTAAEDEGASGGKYVWMPGAPGERGGSSLGSVTWRLNVRKAGEYYVWGRVEAPTPDDDSFFVRLFTDAGDVVGRADWHTGTHERWEWTRMTLGRSREARPLTLYRGEASLQLRVREDGTKIDRLFVTPRADEEPR